MTQRPNSRATTSRTGTAAHLQFRRAVLARDKAAGVTHCPIPGCGVELDYDVSRQPNSAEPDHIIPWVESQSNHPDNGRTICRRCNQSIGNRPDPTDPGPADVTGLIPW